MFDVLARNGVPRKISQPILRACLLLVSAFFVAAIMGCGSSPNTSADNSPPPGSPPGTPRGGTQPQVEKCTNKILPGGDATQPYDLLIDGVSCIVDGSGNAGNVCSPGKMCGSYVYRNVNILNGGSLSFADNPVSPQINFHAHSILVEMGGTLQAGAGGSGIAYPLTIWLYGVQGDEAGNIACVSGGQCGVSDADWNSNPNVVMKTMPAHDSTTSCTLASKSLMPLGDCFYQYEPLEANDPPGQGAYFGSKVLAVSAGGSLTLRGAKGSRPGPIDANPGDSGTSWGRLTKTLTGGEMSFPIDRAVDWTAGDHIVVTTTDYLTSHSEELVISSVDKSSNTIHVTTPVVWPHNGNPYDYSKVAAANPTAGPTPDPATTLPAHNIETRAIVALLTRNIVIASEGPSAITDPSVTDHFPVSLPRPTNFDGGHTVVREGFKVFQVQGVEFYQLGQGGYIGHYPVHFHMDRTVPQPDPPGTTGFMGTYVADSSIVDSMTRFITVHATQGVILARNVGYKSIGHGFYLEDATEINNKVYSNAAISVRGGLTDLATNPRQVPGILFTNQGSGQIQDNSIIGPGYVNQTDVTNPSAFWIMNTWNDFEYNAAVGTGTCGACYWMPPAGISGPSQYETWTDYAGMQQVTAFDPNGVPSGPLFGAVPLMKFKGNSCRASMNSLMTVGQTSQCSGVNYGPGTDDASQLYAVPDNPHPNINYPVVTNLRTKTTTCNPLYPNQIDACATTVPCAGTEPALDNCAATVIDHYTTSFNWAQTNLAAVWLRAWWYLVDNSAITDVQNGGLTFVSGGGYTRSDAPQSYWSVLKNSILVGNTQAIASSDPTSGLPANPYASNAGPFNPSGLKNCNFGIANYCVSQNDGISFQGSDFAINQRLFSIYDGPTDQYNNIYSDIHVTKIGTVADCKPSTTDSQGNITYNPEGNCRSQQWFNGFNNGVLQQTVGKNPPNSASNNCILPNAAIAWKQPNGFYYPPAFNSSNLVYNNVDLHHFVIQPLYLPGGGYNPDLTAVQNTYCTWNTAVENGFTDIDRQTELTDNDGSLTGLTSNNTQATPQSGPTISITKLSDLLSKPAVSYFNAPLATDECASGQLPPATPTASGAGATVSTSPYEYLTTVLYPSCAASGSTVSCTTLPWTLPCQTQSCYGVPLYRQTVTDAELKGIAPPTDLTNRPAVRMMGQQNGQRSTLTLNHAHYYIDTSLSGNAQKVPTSPEPPVEDRANVFQAGQTYSVFVLFGTNNTRQRYSLYIGPNLSQQEAMSTFVAARVVAPNDQFIVTPSSGSWATFDSYDSTTGVLTVKLDLSSATDLKADANSCKPANFCSWNGNSCECKAGSGCTDDKICSFGGKHIDCPVGGCYGFSFTMPAGFVATDAGVPPPTPQTGDLFENTDPPYFQQGTVTFTSASQNVAGACHYSNPPTQGMVGNSISAP